MLSFINYVILCLIIITCNELNINQRQSGDNNNTCREFLYRARFTILNHKDHEIMCRTTWYLKHTPIDKAVEYFVQLIDEPLEVCSWPTRHKAGELQPIMSKL